MISRISAPTLNGAAIPLVARQVPAQFKFHIELHQIGQPVRSTVMQLVKRRGAAQVRCTVMCTVQRSDAASAKETVKQSQ